MKKHIAFGVLSLAGLISLNCRAEDEIKIGAIYPLTGSSASAGQDIKNGIELAVEIINKGEKKIPNLPFSQGGGLSNLKGAKIKVIFADHKGTPEAGYSEAQKLIQQEKITALLGSYNSNVSASVSQAAEQAKIPMLCGESSSPTLTQKNFKFFFRTSPHDGLFVQNFFEFLDDLKKQKKIAVNKIGIFNENTTWGNETTKLESQYIQQKGYTLVRSVNYTAKSPQLDKEVEGIKAANPQVVFQASYFDDAVLSVKTYKAKGFNPDMIIANNAGFTDSKTIAALGKDVNYIITREVWALDLADKNPLIQSVNTLYKAKYKADLNGNSARAFTGMMVLADAINRAKSTDAEAIRKALSETNISGDKLIMPWKGVKFDASGQNTLGSGILTQIINGKYTTIWPFAQASKEVVWPMPAWDKR